MRNKKRFNVVLRERCVRHGLGQSVHAMRYPQFTQFEMRTMRVDERVRAYDANRPITFIFGLKIEFQFGKHASQQWPAIYLDASADSDAKAPES